MKRAIDLLLGMALLAGCAAQKTAAPVTTTVTATIRTTTLSTVTATVTEAPPAEPASEDAKARRTLYNALDAAGIQDVLAQKTIDPTDFYVPFQSYERAGIPSAGSSDGLVAQTINATNGYIKQMMGYDPTTWDSKDVAEMKEADQNNSSICGDIGAWG